MRPQNVAVEQNEEEEEVNPSQLSVGATTTAAASLLQHSRNAGQSRNYSADTAAAVVCDRITPTINDITTEGKNYEPAPLLATTHA